MHEIPDSELILRTAEVTLKKYHSTCDQCQNYHLSNIFRRLKTPLFQRLADFQDFQQMLTNFLAQSGDDDPNRIAIIGTTDWTLPAIVLHAMEVVSNARLELIVIDRCELPLHLTRLYAQKTSQKVAILNKSFENYLATPKYDLMLLHGVFSLFNDQIAGLSAIKRNLSENGEVMLSHAIGRPGKESAFLARENQALENLHWVQSRIEWPADLDIKRVEADLMTGLRQAENRPDNFQNDLELEKFIKTNDMKIVEKHIVASEQEGHRRRSSRILLRLKLGR